MLAVTLSLLIILLMPKKRYTEEKGEYKEVAKTNGLDSFVLIHKGEKGKKGAFYKACAYKKNGETLTYMPYDIEGVEPVYTELKGWETDLTKLRSEEELPEAFKEYIKFLEKELGVPVKYLSIGPDRDQTITRSI